MNILKSGYAIFWKMPGAPVQQFHADMFPLPGETVRDVVARFRDMFPRDIVCSVRDGRGRFLPFREGASA